jgi:peroxiredoxin
MKTTKLLMLLPALFLAYASYAQNKTGLSLSTPYPEAGNRISITYDAASTNLNGKDSLKARVYYIDNKNFPVDEIALRQNGKLWQGEVTINDSAKAFVIKVLRDTIADNNKGKGYVYLVYKDQKPINGAYAAKAYVYQIGKQLSVDPDMAEAMADYQKESDLHANGKSSKKPNYALMARSQNPAKRAIVDKAIDSLERSGTENNMFLANTLLASEHKYKAADSLIAIGKLKYPNSHIARYALENEFFATTNLAKKDSIYQLYKKDDHANKSVLQYMAALMAFGYLKAENLEKYKQYKKELINTTDLIGSFNSVAYDWAVAGKHLPEAEELSKETIDSVTAHINHPISKNFLTADEFKADNMQRLDSYTDTYAYILFKEGKNYTGALKLEAPIWERNQLDADVTQHYALLLMVNDDYTKATAILEATIKSGKETPGLSEALKKSYQHKNGSDKGFDTYVAQLNEVSSQKAKEALAKEMINIPAPAFILKDLDGNPVSLASLKGKTVIVDFWATWCGPCKASMPGMQIAVNKYKSDPNIKFLFIDTWENGDDYLPKVKKFIGDNKYTFDVLVDEKDKTGAQAKVISQFKVDGIPTKFIIDKNGNIRFKHVGYDGSDDAVVNIVSSMIDMAKM